MAITSPLDITWDHAYWCEGPEFKALYTAAGAGTGGWRVGSMEMNPGVAIADNTRISNWPDEVGTLDAVQATAANQPHFYNVGSAFNGKPYIDFPAQDVGSPSSAVGLRTATFTGVAQPTEVVVICRQTATPSIGGEFFWGLTSGASQTHFVQANNATTWRIYAGSGLVTGAIVDTNAHLFDAQFNTTSSALVIDGTSAVSGNAGSQNIGRYSIGGDGLGGNVFPQIVFVGVRLGALLTAGNRTDLRTWASSYYGTP